MTIKALSTSGRFLLGMIGAVVERHLVTGACNLVPVKSFANRIHQLTHIYSMDGKQPPVYPYIAIMRSWGRGLNIVGKAFRCQSKREASKELKEIFEKWLELYGSGTEDRLSLKVNLGLCGIQPSKSEVKIIPEGPLPKLPGPKPAWIGSQKYSPWEIISQIMRRRSQPEVVTFLVSRGLTQQTAEQAIEGFAQMALSDLKAAY
ncbi:MAG: hypothetical protein PHW60_03685 [Kiritimatiellae bacterium]|nr:hypothetical protein [Kiritimatiellia bacterium]